MSDAAPTGTPAGTSEGHEPKRALAAVIALVILVRLGLALTAISYSGDPSRFSSPDTSSYLAPVESMMHGAFRTDGEPEIRRTPGYPLLLVPGVFLGHVETVTIGLQLLLSAATARMVYALAILLFDSRRIGLLAALLYALEPLSVVLSVKLLSETLFTFLFFLGLYALFLYFRDSGWGPLLGSGVALAAATYVRPIAYFLPVVLIPFLLLGREWRVTRRRVAGALIFLAVYGAIVGAWQVRNQVVAGYPRFSGTEEIALWLYAIAMGAEEDGTDFLTRNAEMGGGPVGYWKLHPEQMEWTQKDRLAHLREQAMSRLAGHPFRYLKVHLRGSAATLFAPGARRLMELFVAEPRLGTAAWQLLTIGLGALLLVTYLLSVLGLAALARRGVFPALLLLVIAGYFALLSGGPNGTGRYRQPLMPLFCILAAAGLVRLRTRAEVGAPSAAGAP
jgi:4-amino-4-deoxy-L-arabinose transferase-like glycosyltransferase